LLQDLLTIKQNSSYELFLFFHDIFSFFLTVLVVHPHHDHPVTTVLTHYSFAVADLGISFGGGGQMTKADNAKKFF